MLKNTRDYLENQLTYFNEDIKLTKRNCDFLKAEYAEAKKLAAALEEKENAKSDLCGNIIIDLMVALFIGGLVIGTSGFFSNLSICLCAYLGIHIGFSIKKVVKASKLFKKMQEESEYYIKELIEPKSDYERILRVSYQEPISRYEKIIEDDKECLMILWNTLSSDDFIGMIEKYGKEWWIYKDALLTEWEVYLDEISHITPGDIQLVNEEELKDIKPVSLNLRPKHEKSHNLAIK